MNKEDLYARRLRKSLTDAEQVLWQQLCFKQFGYKFRRQSPIGSCIVDFVCYEQKLIIEVDGGQHSENRCEDDVRSQWLAKEGFRVLRFWNHEVLKNLDAVKRVVTTHLTPASILPHEGGGSA